MDPKYTTLTGGFPLSHHFEMLTDRARVAAFQRAIDHYASAQKTLLEIGVGTGVLLDHARHGFSAVTGLEADPKIFDVARKTLSRPGPSNWDLVAADAREVEALSRADVLVCELISTWCMFEPMVEVMRALDKLGVIDGVNIIPRRIVNVLELVEAPFKASGVELRTPYFEFCGLAAPVAVGLPVVAYELDFSRPTSLPERKEGAVALRPLFGALVNAVRLSCFVDIAPGVGLSGTETLTPPLIFPLSHDLMVHPEDSVLVAFDCIHGAGLEGLSFSASRA